MSPIIFFGVSLVVFVAAALTLIAFTGRRRAQWIVIGVTTVLMLAAAVLTRFW